MKLICSIKGLDCANCAIKLEDKIKSLDNVNLASVNFLTEKMSVICQDDADVKQVFEDIKKACHTVEPDAEVKLLK